MLDDFINHLYAFVHVNSWVYFSIKLSTRDLDATLYAVECKMLYTTFKKFVQVFCLVKMPG